MGCAASTSSAHAAHSRNSWVAIDINLIPKDLTTLYNAPHGRLPTKRVGLLSLHGTRSAGMAGEEVIRKTNQDRGFVSYPIGADRKQVLLAVYDGHGDGGERVSQLAGLMLVDLLNADAQALSRDPAGFLASQLQAVDAAVKANARLHSGRCGTTAIVALLRERHVFVACVGDSRCVKATRRGSCWHATELSSDQKPDRADEAVRIADAGGYVKPSWGPDPARVWKSQDASDKRTGHNLAMSRSIGDHDLEQCGVTAVAEVKEFELNEADACLILASDGVWEFLSSQEAVDICQEFKDDATKACRSLVRKACDRWIAEGTGYRDDITAIVVFLPVMEELRANSSCVPTESPPLSLMASASIDIISSVKQPADEQTLQMPLQQPSPTQHVQPNATQPTSAPAVK
mmetsp:Transcript_17226/g.33600  ORF Transcript_17226/g.33600 Transcript_17226/m.33600 type:complete len:403 (-) Transcript_17226:655-1863(-)